ncbi:MAG: 3-oxoacyl-ACP reductase FabG [Saprospiraceae bacterium]|nr:3-oxoacyl-ACP reductase FabG [Saprospiraceae bacterium]
MNSLSGKVAIITGGCSGLGKATAVRFLEEGAKVVVWDINKERGLNLVKELGNDEKEIVFYEVNVSSFNDVHAVAQKVADKFGQIDILINNAGITRDATLLKMSEHHCQQVIDINLTGVFNCTKAAAPFMVSKSFGRIVNISSVVGLYGNFGQTNYAAAKAGVIAMTKTWSRELGPKGINVNAIAPGFIHTEILDQMPEDVLGKMISKISLRRLGKPEDIANINAFLTSSQADYINGSVISVDGGLVL